MDRHIKASRYRLQGEELRTVVIDPDKLAASTKKPVITSFKSLLQATKEQSEKKP